MEKSNGTDLGLDPPWYNQSRNPLNQFISLPKTLLPLTYTGIIWSNLITKKKKKMNNSLYCELSSQSASRCFPRQAQPMCYFLCLKSSSDTQPICLVNSFFPFASQFKHHFLKEAFFDPHISILCLGPLSLKLFFIAIIPVDWIMETVKLSGWHLRFSV